MTGILFTKLAGGGSSSVIQVSKSIGDGVTNNTATIQAELDSLFATYPNGSVLGFTKGNYVASQIVIHRNQMVVGIEGVQAVTFTQAANSNSDFITSENFAALTGTGAIYGTNPLVPSWYGLCDVHINGNASNQGAGNWRGIAFYGNAIRMLGNILVENCKQDNIYTESAGGFAYSATDWRSAEEGLFEYIESRNAGRHGWLFRGPHDSRIIDLLSFENGGTGFRCEVSGTTYVGSCHIDQIHTYTNGGGLGQYYGTSCTISKSYSDFDNITLDGPGTMIEQCFQIQQGYTAGVNSLIFTANANFCTVGSHKMDFYPSATNIVGVEIQSGGGSVTIANSQACKVPGTSGITLYKVRSNFCTINAQASNATGAGSVAFDINAAYTKIKGSGYSNTTHVLYGGGNNNDIELEVYGGTTVLTGSAGVTDSFKITSDQGSTISLPAFSMSSPHNNSGQVVGNFGGMMTGFNIPAYQIQVTFKGAEANSGYSKQVPVTGFTISVGLSVSQLLLDPAGTLATGTINFPSAPVDGQKLTISSTTIITALTLAYAGGTIKNPVTTLAAGQAVGWQYVVGNTTWYRIQ